LSNIFLVKPVIYYLRKKPFEKDFFLYPHKPDNNWYNFCHIAIK